MTDMNEVILKTDRRGRLRYTEEQKQLLVEAYEASGLSGPRFAALHGVNYQTLVSWLRKRKEVAEPHPAFCSLVPAELESFPPVHSAPVELFLPCGTRIAIHSPAHAAIAAALIREIRNTTRPC